MSLPEWFNNATKQRKFSDLHSDLMGMASWEFWVNKVMKELIPKLVKEKKIEWYMTKNQLTFANVLNRAPARNFCEGDEPRFEYIADELKEWCELALRAKIEGGYRNFYFTYDVVYTVDKLMQAFNVERLDYLAWELGTDVGEFGRSPHIVWNAKKQLFEERQGVTNSRLLQLIEKKYGGSSVGRLPNCFAVLDSNGVSPHRSVIFDLFGRVPLAKIYPMQHALKESMYEQYLEIFDELINHLVNDVFIPSGVGYVEFSVSHSNITKPWVFKHLYNSMLKHSRDVTIRYLVNFQQNDETTPAIQDVMKDRLDLDGLLNLSVTEYRAYMQALCQDKCIFDKSLGMLGELKGMLTNDMAAQKFMHAVVGFDYTGDQEHPFCPFGLTEFTDFVKDCRVRHNERFGFNFHCKKFNVNPESPNDHVYMLIIAQIIQNILNAFPNGSVTPLRMGQMIGFLAFKDVINRHERSLGPIDREMIATFKLMNNRQVVIGINTKTNELIMVHGLKNPMDLVSQFDNMGFPVALCSDSAGVWNSVELVDGKIYRSPISGFIHLIRTCGLIELTGNQLIGNGIRGRFEDPDFRRRANPELYAKSASSGGIQFIQNVTPEMAKAAIQMTGEPSKVTKPNQLLENLRKQVATAQKQYIE